MTYDEAFALLREYNSEPFHITHAPVSYTHLDVYKRQMPTCSMTR